MDDIFDFMGEKAIDFIRWVDWHGISFVLRSAFRAVAAGGAAFGTTFIILDFILGKVEKGYEGGNIFIVVYLLIVFLAVMVRKDY